MTMVVTLQNHFGKLSHFSVMAVLMGWTIHSPNGGTRHQHDCAQTARASTNTPSRIGQHWGGGGGGQIEIDDPINYGTFSFPKYQVQQFYQHTKSRGNDLSVMPEGYWRCT